MIAAIARLYVQAGLQPPALNSAMLCRWEHGDRAPSTEYADALCRLYGVPAPDLGLAATALSGGPASQVLARPGRPPAAEPREAGPGPSAAARRWTSAAAVRESVQLAMQAEGPGGGPVTREQLEQAVRYYDLNYAAFPPGLLASEVHSCRAAVTRMLDHRQPAAVRRRLLHLGSSLSALLGNLAFHAADFTAAGIHLSTAAGLAASIDDRRLLSWALGAQSMLASTQGRPGQALDLAALAVRTADTPLRRAQVIAWAQLPALVRLGRGDDARRVMTAAQRAMDASPVPEEAGRFGFDRAELGLHLAEAAWGLGDYGAVGTHAEESLRHATHGRPGWAAATLMLARGAAARGSGSRGAELALDVLDTIPPEMLRSTAWDRLTALDEQLAAARSGGLPAAELHERLLAGRRAPAVGLLTGLVTVPASPAPRCA